MPLPKQQSHPIALLPIYDAHDLQCSVGGEGQGEGQGMHGSSRAHAEEGR